MTTTAEDNIGPARPALLASVSNAAAHGLAGPGPERWSSPVVLPTGERKLPQGATQAVTATPLQLEKFTPNNWRTGRALRPLHGSPFCLIPAHPRPVVLQPP